jgi:hypothetical protein
MVVEKKPKRRLPLVLMIVILILAVCGLLVWQNPEIYRKVIAPFHHSAAPAPATP